jgi:hypothetical protein
VVVTAPAMLTIDGQRQMTLSRGRLTAHATPGFRIDAPGGISVVDLGTRFNMTVDEASVTRVVVVEGAVKMAMKQPPDGGKPGATMTRHIAAGDAATAHASEGVKLMPAGTHPGETLAITSHPADGCVYEQRSTPQHLGYFDVQNLIVGSAAGPADYSGILLIPLPDRNGMKIHAAGLELPVVIAGSLPGAGVDVWVLGYLRGEARLESRWRITSDTDARSGAQLGVLPADRRPVKVIDDLVRPDQMAEVGQVWRTDAKQSAALAAVINDLYDTGGAEPGDYLVIRLNADHPLAARFDGVSPERSYRNIRFGASHQDDPNLRSKLVLNLNVP